MSQDRARVAVCPRCEGEYLATAIECSDCGVALVHPDELVAHETETLPPVSELTCIRAASVGWTRALSGHLSEAGIPHRIEALRGEDEGDESVQRRPNYRLPYGVYVRSEEAERALEVDASFMPSQIPDLPDEHESSGGVEDVETCPACGERVNIDTSECPSCGLALAIEE